MIIVIGHYECVRGIVAVRSGSLPVDVMEATIFAHTTHC